MDVKREDLLNLLNGIKPAIAVRGDEDMQKKIVFTGTDAVAYSEAMCIVWPFITDFRTVAPSDELIQILNRISADNVKLVYSKDCLNINAGKTKVRIKTDPTSRVLEEVDSIIAAANGEWWQLPAQFLEAVELCMYSTSKDNTQRALMCVYANEDQVVSSDDFRISQYKMTEVVGHAMLIPQPACVELVKNEVETYSVTDTWLLFNSEKKGNVMVASRVVPETYSDVEQFFGFTGEEYKLPGEIKDHLDTVSVLAAGEYDIEKEITVTLAPDKITLHGEQDIGWATVEIKPDKDSQIASPAAFGINPDFFKHILARTNIMRVSPEKGLFEKDNFRHLIGLTVR